MQFLLKGKCNRDYPCLKLEQNWTSLKHETCRIQYQRESFLVGAANRIRSFSIGDKDHDKAILLGLPVAENHLQFGETDNKRKLPTIDWIQV